MNSIYIPQLLTAPENTIEIAVDDYLPDLETLTPIQGMVIVQHQNTYLHVTAKAEAIITLTCDRCLQNYNQRLKVNASEMIWLEAPVAATALPIEQEIEFDDLVETLPPDGYFQPSRWLYEQLCLETPPKKICSEQCGGISLNQDKAERVVTAPIDARWSALTALKDSLSH